MTPLTQAQRAHLIRAKRARLERIEAERRQVATELSQLESRHAISLGMPTLRGKMLLGEMDRRDAAQRAGKGRAA